MIENNLLFKLFKQSSPRDSQFLRGERKSVCRDVVYLVGRLFKLFKQSSPRDSQFLR